MPKGGKREGAGRPRLVPGEILKPKAIKMTDEEHAAVKELLRKMREGNKMYDQIKSRQDVMKYLNSHDGQLVTVPCYGADSGEWIGMHDGKLIARTYADSGNSYHSTYREITEEQAADLIWGCRARINAKLRDRQAYFADVSGDNRW